MAGFLLAEPAFLPSNSFGALVGPRCAFFFVVVALVFFIWFWLSFCALRA